VFESLAATLHLTPAAGPSSHEGWWRLEEQRHWRNCDLLHRHDELNAPLVDIKLALPSIRWKAIERVLIEGQEN
jgi:hypothetical protein